MTATDDGRLASRGWAVIPAMTADPFEFEIGEIYRHRNSGRLVEVLNHGNWPLPGDLDATLTTFRFVRNNEEWNVVNCKPRFFERTNQ